MRPYTLKHVLTLNEIQRLLTEKTRIADIQITFSLTPKKYIYSTLPLRRLNESYRPQPTLVDIAIYMQIRKTPLGYLCSGFPNIFHLAKNSLSSHPRPVQESRVPFTRVYLQHSFRPTRNIARTRSRIFRRALSETTMTDTRESPTYLSTARKNTT